jgi:His/Glu/Gln/Arg/opine family amino acid ABC transporter permease subunit
MTSDIGHLVRTLLFGYPVPPEMVDPDYPQLLQRTGGLALTLLVTAASLLVGFAAAVILVAGRRNPLTGPGRDAAEQLLGQALRRAAIVVVEGVRGLPIILIVLVVFSLPYPLTGLRLPAFVLAVTAFGLYAAVYIAESMRAGLRSVDPQLRAAGRVLGLTSRQVFMEIELPLIYRVMRPDLINVAVTVFKDTSVLAVTAVPELTYTGRQMLMSEPADYGIVLLVVLFLYWAPAAALSAVAIRTEQRRVRLEGFVSSEVRELVGKGRAS